MTSVAVNEKEHSVPVVVYVLPDGERRKVEAVDGRSVMQTAIDALVPGIVGECGGEMSCATCHVFVDEDWAGRFAPVSEDEAAMLEATAAEPTEFSRLSCQLPCTLETDGVVIHIPDEQ
jgi:2Fe-2S ferredoxin